MKRRTHDRNVINGIVTAVDANFSGVIDKKSRENDLDENYALRTVCGPASDHSTFEQLHNAYGQQSELLVKFADWRHQSQSQQNEQPQHIQPIDPSMLFFAHLRNKISKQQLAQ